jgi:N-acetylglucosaminyldiphosphoundecaprenol N-acetyl-beta-D-mannosaminyltransferase
MTTYIDYSQLPPDIAPKVDMLGVGITPTTLPRAIELLETVRAKGRCEYVCCACVNSLVEARRDPKIRDILNRATLTTQDGMPLVWWCHLAGFPETTRVCGRDLMLAICAVGVDRGYRHFFYGGTPSVTKQLITNLSRRFPGLKVVGHHSPPFRQLTQKEAAADVAAINKARPDFVWVGLGTPKQDRWMGDHVSKIDAAILIGVGAAFDYLAGQLQPAPQWMQRAGLEWVFRLASEPRRLAHRYLIGNLIFVACAARQFMRMKSNVSA